MSTDSIPSAEAVELADLRAIKDYRASGTPINADVRLRVEARAQKIREEIRKRGTTNIAVELVREAREQ